MVEYIKFLLCRDLNALPDVWSLYEWSNWVTPKPSPKRFDTAFFVCCTEGEIDAKHDQSETTDLYVRSVLHKV